MTSELIEQFTAYKDAVNETLEFVQQCLTTGNLEQASAAMTTLSQSQARMSLRVRAAFAQKENT